VLATFVPEFPIYPPETSWMRTPRTDIPALTARETEAGGRLVWLLADLDRCYAREGSFEHAEIIASAVRWARGLAPPPVEIEAPGGVVAVTGYAQGNRRIVHLTSRVQTAAVPGRQDVLLAVGPVRLRLRKPGNDALRASLRVAGGSAPVERDGDDAVVTVGELRDHEVVVFENGPAGRDRE
jgi:hypothetical protein